MTIAAVSPLEVQHPAGWTWQPETRRYRDPSTGRFASNATIKQWRDTFLDRRQQSVRDLASALSSGWITSATWREQMGEIQRETYGIMAALGRGGLEAMQLEDWNRVNAQLARQQPYLEKFTKDVESGGLSEAQIGARSELYIGTSVQAFEAGRAAAWGEPDLPQLPGDGNTECGGNCRCTWDINPTETAWECSWTGTNDDRTCMGCAENQDKWDPLIVPYPEFDSALYGPPPDREAEFIIDRAAGMSFKTLGKKYGISDTTAMHWSRQLNVSPGKPPPAPVVPPVIPPPVVIPPTPTPVIVPPKPPVTGVIPKGLPANRVDEFISDRRSGLSFRALGKKYGISDSTAMHWSRSLGIDVAPGLIVAKPVPTPPAGELQSIIWNSKSTTYQSSRNYQWLGSPRFELQYQKGWVLVDNKTGAREPFKYQNDAKKRADALAKADPGPKQVEIKPGADVQVVSGGYRVGHRGTVDSIEITPAGTTTRLGLLLKKDLVHVNVRMASGTITQFLVDDLIGIPPPEAAPPEIKVTADEAKQMMRNIVVEHQKLTDAARHEYFTSQDAERTAHTLWLAAVDRGSIDRAGESWTSAQLDNVRRTGAIWSKAQLAATKAKAQYEKVQKDLQETLREKVLYHPEPAQIKVRYHSTWDAETRTEIEQRIESFKRLVGRGRLDGLEVNVTKTNDNRSFYMNDTINLSAVLRHGSTVVHELGHWLEDRNSIAADMVRDSYNSRTAGENPRRLSDLRPQFNYTASEMSKPDNFFDPYMGKIYYSIKAHELLSMGLELMYNDPLTLADKDPDTFSLVWEILHSGSHVVPSSGVPVERNRV